MKPSIVMIFNDWICKGINFYGLLYYTCEMLNLRSFPRTYEIHSKPIARGSQGPLSLHPCVSFSIPLSISLYPHKSCLNLAFVLWESVGHRILCTLWALVALELVSGALCSSQWCVSQLFLVMFLEPRPLE